MSKYEQIIEAYPELLELSNRDRDAVLKCRDDSDGFGDYVEFWNYDKPLPAGLKVGKN